MKNSFRALLVTQFLGAFNDNLYKIIVSLLVVRLVDDPVQSGAWLSIGSAIFFSPFILFSSYAGFLADRFSKSLIMKLSKLLQIIVMLTGALFFYLENIYGLFVVLFFMGLQSAMFSPCKYGSLPEILDETELSRGNGSLELWTFVAVISGTALSAPVLAWAGEDLYLCGFVAVSIAVMGFLSSLFVQDLPIARPSGKFVANFFADAWQSLKELKAKKNLWIVMLAVNYFWFLGSVFQINIILYAKHILGVEEQGVSILLAIISIGIGGGSWIAGVLSKEKIWIGIVPTALISLACFMGFLTLTDSSFILTAIAMFLVGVSAGFYIVPLTAYFQSKSPLEFRGRYLALSNIVAYSAMLSGSLMMYVLTSTLAISALQIMFLFALMSLIVSVSLKYYFKVL